RCGSRQNRRPRKAARVSSVDIRYLEREVAVRSEPTTRGLERQIADLDRQSEAAGNATMHKCNGSCQPLTSRNHGSLLDDHRALQEVELGGIGAVKRSGLRKAKVAVVQKLAVTLCARPECGWGHASKERAVEAAITLLSMT